MGHSAPDWFPLVRETIFGQPLDIGEQAVRLGSIISYDRRGDIIWFDDMENGDTKWALGGAGTGNAQGITTAAARNGASSMRLTAGRTGLRRASMEHFQPFTPLSLLGLEASWRLEGLITNIDFRMRVFDGSFLMDFEIRWSDTDNELQFSDLFGVFQTISGTAQLQAEATLFHTLKMVVDPTAREYVRVLLDDLQFNVEGNAPTVLASGSAPHTETRIENIGITSVSQIIDVDDVILTQNEPVNP